MDVNTTSDQFDAILSDFDNPSLDGWSLVAHVDDGRLHIYRRLSTDSATSNLYEYKVYGTLRGMNYITAYQVYMDLDYRRQWDNVKPEYLRIRSSSSSGPSEEGEKLAGEGNANNDDAASVNEVLSVYWRIQFPVFFMADRDYVLVRKARKMTTPQGRPCFIVLLHHDPEGSAQEPCPSGVIRVTEYVQSVVFAPPPPRNEADPSNLEETAVYMRYFDNPGGRIPSALINWALATGLPAFLTNFRNACTKAATAGTTTTTATTTKASRI